MLTIGLVNASFDFMNFGQLRSLTSGKFELKNVFVPERSAAIALVCASFQVKFNGGESSSQFRWFIIAKIEL